jgi:hypothetical protein
MPRFSLATTYAPPLVSYALTVCVYERTTMPSTAAIAIETGRTRWAAVIDAPTRTTSAASVAYATDESGSDAKIGSASFFESSVSPISAAARGRPIRARLTASMRSVRSVICELAGGSLVSSIRRLGPHATPTDPKKRLDQGDFERFLRPDV